MTVEYSEAKDVQRLAEQLIPQHHGHLEGLRIEYVFRSEAAKTAGKTVLGKARKISGLNSYLSGQEGEDYFVIEIAEDCWRILDESQRTALVDHELRHCRVSFETDTAYIAPHHHVGEVLDHHHVEVGEQVTLTFASDDDE